MSQAHDLAVSIALASSTPGIAHDPASPLVLGSVAGGEYLVWTYDPITHTADLEVASNVLDLVSTLSFKADGTLLINGLPIASTGSVDDAVEDAEAAAAAAQASAAAADAALVSVNLTKLQIDEQTAEFTVLATEATTQVAADADRAETAVANAESIRNSAAASAESAQTAAADAKEGAVESTLRANADPTFIFDDGTKSSRGYAADAAQSASQSRAATTRPLAASGLPETFVPGFLFTRARCSNVALGIVNIGPNIWTNLAGEAWATYRLEAAGGSIKFVGAGGSSTTTPPSVTTTAPTGKFRNTAPAAATASFVATCTPPTGFTGRVCMLVTYIMNASLPYTISCSMSGGVAVTTRRAPVSPSDDDSTTMGVIYEGAITDWAGGALNISLAYNAVVLSVVSKPLLVSGGDVAAAPIVGFAKPVGNQTTAALVLPTVPAQSLILGAAFQKRLTASFSAWSPNLTLIEKGNLLGVGPSVDANDFRNGSYGIGSGIAAGAGDFTLTANYTGAVDRIGVLGVAYPPGVGVSTPLVNMTFAGGRDTLTEVGAEAEVWFNPDGRAVFVQIPKP